MFEVGEQVVEVVVVPVIPLPVEIDSFNAQPEAPARSGPTAKKAGASGWALNEQMYHFSPVGV